MPRPPSGFASLLVLISTGLTAGLAAPAPAGAEGPPPERFLAAVVTYADHVLTHGRDSYGATHTPLFVDGLHVDTRDPVKWRHKGQTWIMSNLASQQNLFRVLAALSEITRDAKYRQAAVDAIAYTFDNLQYDNGLLPWGGHASYDALGERIVGEGRHELEQTYPYYELMWQVNPEGVRRFVEGAWSTHVLDWARLDFDRHASFRTTREMSPWERDYAGSDLPFVGKGQTFMMAGTDLAQAAAMLSLLSGDERPLPWSKRLLERYVDARHPETGLGATNFTTKTDPCRMHKQFPQFGGRFTEATVTDLYFSRYRHCAISQLRMGEMLGDRGKEFVQWAREDLTARARHGYDKETNSFGAMLIDGTKLSPSDRINDGYVAVRWLEKRKADGLNFLAYALAWRLTGDPLMLDMTRVIGTNLGLGDLAVAAGNAPSPGQPTESDDPLLIFGLLEIYDATKERAYLELARRVGANVLRNRFHNGFFVATKAHLYCRFDDPTALALLHLHAALQGGKRPPKHWGGESYFYCIYDEHGRSLDRDVIYSQRR